MLHVDRQSPVVVVGDDAHRVPRRAVADVAIERLRIVGAGATGDEHLAERAYLTNSAVVLRGARRIVLRDLEIEGCRSACVLTEHDCREVAIERSDVGRSVWDGIALNRTRGARLIANTIHDDTAAGITCEHLEGSLVAGNVLARNGTHAIYLSDSYRNVVRDNRLVDNVVSGVFLTCAVRVREPAVRCWPDSMSAGNRFERNVFAGNREAFMVGADRAANCHRKGFAINRSEDDRVDGVFLDPRAATAGRCLVRVP